MAGVRQPYMRVPTEASIGADYNHYTTVDTGLKLSPGDDTAFPQGASTLLDRVLRPPIGSCGSAPHVMPPAAPEVTVQPQQARIAASLAPSDLVRAVGQQQGQGLLAVASSAKPIASIAPQPVAVVTARAAEKQVLSAKKAAALVEQLNSDYDQHRRVVPFTFMIHRTPAELAAKDGRYTFKLPLADEDAKNSHIIVEKIQASISTNSIIKTGVHFPALDDSYRISYDNGNLSTQIHMLCPAVYSVSASVEAYRRKDIPNLYFATRYGDIRSREQIKSAIIPDEKIADRYHVCTDSAIARVAFTPDQMKDFKPQPYTGTDGKQYIETTGRKAFDKIAAYIESQLFDHTSDHGKNIIDPQQFQVELIPIGIGATWTNLPGVPDQELMHKQPIDVTISGEMSVFLVPKPNSTKP